MDNFDYKSYLKSGKIYGNVNETKILKESEEISEKKYSIQKEMFSPRKTGEL